MRSFDQEIAYAPLLPSGMSFPPPESKEGGLSLLPHALQWDEISIAHPRFVIFRTTSGWKKPEKPRNLSTVSHLQSTVPIRAIVAIGCLISPVAIADPGAIPRVSIQTKSVQPVPSGRAPARHANYPWKTHITATVFWIGEQPTKNNPTPNHMSSWDTRWKIHYGGYDNPDPATRVACHTTGDFRPKAFKPQLNPFYIALPYNDVMRGGRHKPEAARVIPWFQQYNPQPGHTVLKGRWVQIHFNGRNCFAQWEDCGPWVTDDWTYVFGNKPPKTRENQSAGIDLSPAVRDFLGMRSHQRVHWRFVEDHQVPPGPWLRYGPQPSPQSAAARAQDFTPAAVNRRPSGPIHRPGPNADIETQRQYLEYLRELRDMNFEKKPLRDLQR